MAQGTIVTGKLAAALQALGSTPVFDTNFTADLTIMEEGYELIERVTEGGRLPQITSCSPGWIKFIEHFYPELLPQPVHLQVAAADVRGPGQDLLRREDRHRPGQDRLGVRHALHGQEVRVRAPEMND